MKRKIQVGIILWRWYFINILYTNDNVHLTILGSGSMIPVDLKTMSQSPQIPRQNHPCIYDASGFLGKIVNVGPWYYRITNPDPSDKILIHTYILGCFRNTWFSGGHPFSMSPEFLTVKHSGLRSFVCFLKHLEVAQNCRFSLYV